MKDLRNSSPTARYVGRRSVFRRDPSSERLRLKLPSSYIQRSWPVPGASFLTLRTLPLALFAMFVAGSAASLSAQQVTLFLVDGDDLTPISGATVSLLTPDEESVWSGLSDEAGSVGFSPPSPGEYYIVAVGFGFEPYRSPLLAVPEDGSYTLEIPLAPAPVPIEGVTVSVERSANEMLVGLGVSIHDLGNRWIDRVDIERVKFPLYAGDVIRGQNIPGLIVDEKGTPGQSTMSKLCIRFNRGDFQTPPRSRLITGWENCAMVVVDGAITDLQGAALLDPHSFRAIAILRPVEARFLYGETGEYGAVVIWLGRDRP